MLTGPVQNLLPVVARGQSFFHGYFHKAGFRIWLQLSDEVHIGGDHSPYNGKTAP